MYIDLLVFSWAYIIPLPSIDRKSEHTEGDREGLLERGHDEGVELAARDDHLACVVIAEAVGVSLRMRSGLTWRGKSYNTNVLFDSTL